MLEDERPVKRWYAVQTHTSAEKRVKEFLEERIRTSDALRTRFGEVWLPTEKIEEMRNGKKYSSERKIYPGYVLVEMEADQETCRLVKDVPKVIEFLGRRKDGKLDGDDLPTPIPDDEINRIRLRQQEGDDKPRPKVLFEPGETVRVIEGPFKEFNGVVEEVSYEKSRLRVTVHIFGRPTPVDVDFGDVVKD
ncbi:transcription termination/antitermination protein NusG [Thioalkalivibrio sp. HK1]|uniref:transcription termination/antitermination protein NusG n=1 Tax=Thioalkalivibrio sp. HK1 TaxID=1469245 RepID=UPI0004721C1B|nr:transcription termination/antitermination protein NusG [Thioalkalivibrio sp. HK1]